MRAARRPPERGAEVRPHLACVLHRIVEYSSGLRTRRTGEENEDRVAPVRVEHFAERDDVADRLRHLLLGQLEQAVVGPEPCERAARSRRLSELVLVVRKAEVEPAAVELELGAEMLLGHRGALDVPAWTAASHGESQDVSSLSFVAFQSAKSRGSSLRSLASSCEIMSSSCAPERRP